MPHESRSRGVNHRQHPDRFPSFLELARDFKSYYSTKRHSQQVVRAVRLHRLDMLRVRGSHLFHRTGRPLRFVERLNAIKWLIQSEASGQRDIRDDMSASGVNREDRRLRTKRL